MVCAWNLKSIKVRYTNEAGLIHHVVVHFSVYFIFQVKCKNSTNALAQQCFNVSVPLDSTTKLTAPVPCNSYLLQ